VLWYHICGVVFVIQLYILVSNVVATASLERLISEVTYVCQAGHLAFLTYTLTYSLT